MTDKNPRDDKTVVSPRRTNTNTDRHTTDEAQKTVLKQASDDKTRISPSRVKQTAPQNSTVEPTSDNDKTQIAPSKVSSKSNARLGELPQERASSIEPVELTGNEQIINNRFVLKESLGAGGMAMVYRALDLRKQETGDKDPYIAIKILSSEFEEHPQAFVSLQREAKKSQILSHPNVIKVFDFDRDGDLVYLTMEELRGQPLRKLIQEYIHGLPLDMAVPIIQAISDGLAYAHKKNIVHADLKPDNIFYTDDGEVKIIDFGIARMMTDLDAKGGATSNYDPDEVVGLTPSYASLEMLEDEAPIPSDDIYALGLISYELLTGRHPFDSEQADVAFEKQLTFNKVTQLKGYQWKAIASALSFEHQDRLKNGEEFRDLFSGKGRTVKRLVAGLVTISIVFIASLFVPRDTDMDHLYEELPPAEKAKFDGYMTEGTTLLGFDDWNNALAMFEQAHAIAPQQSSTQEALNEAVAKIIKSFEDNASALSSQQKITQIDQLLKYQSLTDNERLLKYKEKLQSK